MLPENVDEVKKWKDGKGHNWTEYFRRALEFESISHSKIQIKKREKLLRSKIKKFYFFDQKNTASKKHHYDVLSVQFVPDSSSKTSKEFIAYTKNILGYLKNEGLLVMGVLKRSKGYLVGNKKIPAAYLTEDSIEKHAKDIGIKIIRMASFTTYDKQRGIDGYILFLARKNN